MTNRHELFLRLAENLGNAAAVAHGAPEGTWTWRLSLPLRDAAETVYQIAKTYEAAGSTAEAPEAGQAHPAPPTRPVP